MRQAPFGVLHSLSIRLTTHKRLDARVHLGPQIADCMCNCACRLVRDPPLWSTRPVRSSKEECTAALPAVWRTP